MERPADDARVSDLTVSELRWLLDDASSSYGMEADSEVGVVLTEVRDLRERLEDAVDFMLDVYEWWQGQPEAARIEVSRARTEARVDEYARAVLELRDPTQAELAEHLGVSDRWVRAVGWDRILKRAAELAEEGGTPE